MDDQVEPEKTSSLPKGRRLMFVLLLLVLYGILGITSFLESPRCLYPLGSHPPNKEVEWTEGMDIAAHVTVLFSNFWWAFALLVIGLALLAFKGKLDYLLTPLLVLILIGGLSATGLLWYIRSLPESVEKSHGLETRKRIFGPGMEK
jgi:hypothetical protein